MHKPLNTLDADVSNPNERPQSRRSNASPNSPSPKRQKIAAYTEARLQPPLEDIEDFDEQSVGRRRSGSHGSLLDIRPSTSPVLPEMSIGGLESGKPVRSNRRRRNPDARHNTQSPHFSHPPKRSRMHQSDSLRDQNEDGIEAISPGPASTVNRLRKVRLTAPNPQGGRYNSAVNDAADLQILQGSGHSQRSADPKRGQKRSSLEINDGDELAGEPTPVVPIHLLPEPAPSVSRRGDLTATKFVHAARSLAATGLPVKSACCLQVHRFLAKESQEEIRLRPVLDGGRPELRAITSDGKVVTELKWLRITCKVQMLRHNSESNLIMIKQSTDSAILAYGQMFIEFENPEDAEMVVAWVKDNLKVTITEESTGRLNSIVERLSRDVVEAIRQDRPRPSVTQTPQRPIQTEIGRPDGNKTTPNTPATLGPRVSLKDRMQVSTTPSIKSRDAEPSSNQPASSSRPRRSRQGNAECRDPRPLQPSPPPPPRWTEQNSGWEKEWKVPHFVFNRTTVDRDDIPRLDDGQFLNDNLIGFGLRYLFDSFRGKDADLGRRVYLLNSFFYEKLKGPRNTINYDSVKNWTAKVDLLSYDYIVVPVNENFHWWVAIICNPGKLDPEAQQNNTAIEEASDQSTSQDAPSADVEMIGVSEAQPKPPMDATGRVSTQHSEGQRRITSDIVDLSVDDKGPDTAKHLDVNAKQRNAVKPPSRKYHCGEPKIITLDSLNGGHNGAIALLKKYLIAEFQDKRKKVITSLPQNLGMKAVNIPLQQTHCDCGVYLLGYIQEFVQGPDKFIQSLLDKERLVWEIDAADLRALWRDTIFIERNMYMQKLGLIPAPLTEKAASESPLSTTKGKATGQPVVCDAAPTKAVEEQPMPDVIEVLDSNIEPSTQADPRNIQKVATPSATRSGSSPRQTSFQQDHDEVVLLPDGSPDIVMQSIESTARDRLPRSPKRRREQHRPSLGSPKKRVEDLDPIEEVNASDFYSRTNTPARSANQMATSSRLSLPKSSPVRTPQPQSASLQLGMPRPTHTQNRFALVSPNVGVVHKAEVVRSVDVDMTNDSD
ncbi:ubiquitin-like-specific protease 2 [Podospora australis]|uniref:Ubiquitin-like-specific protease 2 n=1 Tax=Podospora australis TaxID=1536484 RepID=A0AAN6WUG8_9PEZI|nr:ubiquitin-like-specific protease 2 [Podospora australis]